MAPRLSKIVTLCVLLVGCSKPDVRVGDSPTSTRKVALGTLLKDESGHYNDRFVQTTGAVVSRSDRWHTQLDWISLSEPGTAGDGPLMYCVMAHLPAAPPGMGDVIDVVGTKKNRTLEECSIVSDGGR